MFGGKFLKHVTKMPIYPTKGYLNKTLSFVIRRLQIFIIARLKYEIILIIS